MQGATSVARKLPSWKADWQADQSAFLQKPVLLIAVFRKAPSSKLKRRTDSKEGPDILIMSQHCSNISQYGAPGYPKNLSPFVFPEDVVATVTLVECIGLVCICPILLIHIK